MANLPNDVVSLVHIPKVPSFPDYSGATSDTVNVSENYNVQFYSIVIYGATKQLDAYGSIDNSQIGNKQVQVSPDGSATVVLWPQSASSTQVNQIAAVAKAIGPIAGSLTDHVLYLGEITREPILEAYGIAKSVAPHDKVVARKIARARTFYARPMIKGLATRRRNAKKAAAASSAAAKSPVT